MAEENVKKKSLGASAAKGAGGTAKTQVDKISESGLCELISVVGFREAPLTDIFRDFHIGISIIERLGNIGLKKPGFSLSRLR